MRGTATARMSAVARFVVPWRDEQMLFPENDLNEINNNHLELPLPGARFEWSHNLKHKSKGKKITEEMCIEKKTRRKNNPFCAIWKLLTTK